MATLWLLALIVVGVGHLMMDVIALVVLILILILLHSAVAVRSALAKGRAPSRVGVPHLLIEVGVMARAGRAGLLDSLRADELAFAS